MSKESVKRLPELLKNSPPPPLGTFLDHDLGKSWLSGITDYVKLSNRHGDIAASLQKTAEAVDEGAFAGSRSFKTGLDVAKESMATFRKNAKIEATPFNFKLLTATSPDTAKVHAESLVAGQNLLDGVQAGRAELRSLRREMSQGRTLQDGRVDIMKEHGFVQPPDDMRNAYLKSSLA